MLFYFQLTRTSRQSDALNLDSLNLSEVSTVNPAEIDDDTRGNANRPKPSKGAEHSKPSHSKPASSEHSKPTQPPHKNKFTTTTTTATPQFPSLLALSTTTTTTTLPPLHKPRPEKLVHPVPPPSTYSAYQSRKNLIMFFSQFLFELFFWDTVIFLNVRFCISIFSSSTIWCR